MTKETVLQKKEEFARKYEGKAPEYLAILAAVQRAHLYSPTLSSMKRCEIRTEWASKLKELGSRYRQERSVEEFIADIDELKRHMNEAFPDSFVNSKKNYSNGFRLAHAQKSLSIYLKHCWCRGQIDPVPPTCPIDGNVLSWVGIRQAWTKCDSIEDCNGVKYSGYRSQMKHIISFASSKEPDLSVFEWELCNFKSNSDLRADKESKLKG